VRISWRFHVDSGSYALVFFAKREARGRNGSDLVDDGTGEPRCWDDELVFCAIHYPLAPA
jgi:hypothetical protein